MSSREGCNSTVKRNSGLTCERLYITGKHDFPLNISASSEGRILVMSIIPLRLHRDQQLLSRYCKTTFGSCQYHMTRLLNFIDCEHSVGKFFIIRSPRSEDASTNVRQLH